MTSSVVRAGVDTYVDSTKPSKNFHKGQWLRCTVSTKESLLRMKSPAPRGATILVAKLVLTQVQDVAGAHEIRVQRTLTPPNMQTVRWNNKPVGSGAVATMTKTGSNRLTAWEINVTTILQQISDGLPNNGFRITSQSANEIKFFSHNASGRRPYLVVVWSTQPQAPTQVSPAGGGVVATSHPVLMCDFSDNSGVSGIAAMQVQIDAADDFTTGIDFDSGEVTVDVPQLPLADTAYPGLANGATTYWRVRVKDEDNLWSAWSDSFAMTHRAYAVLTMLNPDTVTPVVHEFTPPIIWSLSQPQTHFQVLLARPSAPSRYIYNSGKIASPDTAHTIPARVLSDDQDYLVIVRAYDQYDRVLTVGQPPFVQAVQQFTVDYDATVDPPTSLVCEQDGSRPWVDLTFTRDDAPDSWTIIRDGVAIETDVDPADIAHPTTPDLYVYRDWTARPEVTHIYRVRAEVNGRLSGNSSPTAPYAPRSVGIWLFDPTTGLEVVLGGRDKQESAPDQAESFTVLGSTQVVRVIQGISGLSGMFSNLMLRSREGKSWQEFEAALYSIKSRPTDEFRLVYGDLNIPVALGEIVIAPHESTITGRVLKSVSFQWWQTREHPFRVEL